MSRVLIIGIDPSITSTGLYYFISDNGKITHHGGTTIPQKLQAGINNVLRIDYELSYLDGYIRGLQKVYLPDKTLVGAEDIFINPHTTWYQLATLHDMLQLKLQNMRLDTLWITPTINKSFAMKLTGVVGKFNKKDCIKKAYSKLVEANDLDLQLPEYSSKIADDYYDAFFLGLFMLTAHVLFMYEPVDNTYLKTAKKEVLENSTHNIPTAVISYVLDYVYRNKDKTHPNSLLQDNQYQVNQKGKLARFISK